jgi:hypothetical protein
MNMIAWGEPRLYGLADGRSVWAREFRLLPGGSMFRASEILSGVIGTELLPCGWGRRQEIPADAPVLMWASDEATAEALLEYEEDLLREMNLQPERFDTEVHGHG